MEASGSNIFVLCPNGDGVWDSGIWIQCYTGMRDDDRYTLQFKRGRESLDSVPTGIIGRYGAFEPMTSVDLVAHMEGKRSIEESNSRFCSTQNTLRYSDKFHITERTPTIIYYDRMAVMKINRQSQVFFSTYVDGKYVRNMTSDEYGEANGFLSSSSKASKMPKLSTLSTMSSP